MDCTFENAKNFGLYTEKINDSTIDKSVAINNGTKEFHDSGFSINGENINIMNCAAKLNKGNGFRIFGKDSFPGGRITISNIHTHHNTNHGLLTTPTGKV